jgi:probable rRNA maturation factor
MPVTLTAPRALARLAPALRALVRAALAPLGRPAGEIAIVLAGDAELRRLNRRYRGIDRATDVLSFSYDVAGEARTGKRLGGPPPPISGDLVVSLDRVRDQARRYRVSRGEELARLVVHGALHLAGLDHDRAPARRAMRAREDRVLRASRPLARRLERILARAADAPEIQNDHPRSDRD